MKTGICQTITSCFRNLSPKLVEGSIIAAGVAANCYLASIPVAILSIGGYLAARIRLVQPIKQAISKNQIIEPIQPEKSVLLRLDATTKLNTFDVPPQLEHARNSCFIASTLQIIMNDPVILKELTTAISRLLNRNSLFQENAVGDDQLGIILSIVDLMGKDSLSKSDLLILCQNLQVLEEDGCPFNESSKELLSLLETYKLIVSAKENGGVTKAQMHSMRATLHRLKPESFSKDDAGPADVYEAFITLTDAIFTDSKINRTLYKTRFVQSAQFSLHPDVGNSQTGAVNEKAEKNWGHFELSLPENGSLQSLLKSQFDVPENYKANFYALQTEKREQFTVINDSMKFDRAPKLLVINMKRFDYEGNYLSNPLEANEVLQLTDHLFKDRKGACYKLAGVINYLPGHYVASVENQVEEVYSCNDIEDGGKIKLSTPKKMVNAAKTGYILHYRKIEDSFAEYEEKKMPNEF
ncbi:MAG: hypothetical protein COT85_07495 [Chlamydiae bacterium CG10_big_fil_rev_8_21_14_0_10_42_34]|nr:MAG: hypothetical protein COT85_07495 [Chlamydiae bacterium CG10_big_fil_rev_8_21_14_0_10_42_34]